MVYKVFNPYRMQKKNFHINSQTTPVLLQKKKDVFEGKNEDGGLGLDHINFTLVDPKINGFNNIQFKLE